MQVQIKQSRITLVEGDITLQETDAIVNPANAQLILGGGVAGAIRMRGGPAIQAACDEQGGTPVGTAVITTAGKLPAKYVIHAVGPRMGEGDEDRKLIAATRAALAVAQLHDLTSLTFPAISTGIFGFPIDRCARHMITTITDVLQEGADPLQDVRICLWGDEAFEIFRKELASRSAD